MWCEMLSSGHDIATVIRKSPEMLLLTLASNKIGPVSSHGWRQGSRGALLFPTEILAIDEFLQWYHHYL